MRILRAALVLFTVLLLTSLCFLSFSNSPAIALPGQIVLCSVYSSGQQFTYVSQAPDITADGRYVVFEGYKDIDETNRETTVFWRDILTGTTRSVSEFAPALRWASEPSITPDGKYIVFQATSESRDLNQAYRIDSSSGTVVLCSSNTLSESSDDSVASLAISANGRYVAFYSAGTNLIPGVYGGNLFRKDLLTGNIQCCSLDSDGQPIDVVSDPPTIRHTSLSADGRFVCFDFTNSIPGSASMRVYRKDMQTQELRICSSDSAGKIFTAGSIGSGSISGDGRYVGFQMSGPNFTNSVYRKDMETGEVLLGSTNASNVQDNGRSLCPQLSQNGRYMVFSSTSTNLIPEANNGLMQVFRRDFLTGELLLCSSDSLGVQGDNGPTRIESIADCTMSSDGRFVAFSSVASNLAPDANVYPDVFRKELPAAGNAPPPPVPADFSSVSYLAEGFTGPSFQEYLTIENPTAARAAVQVLYYFEDAGWAEQDLQVPANSRASLDVNAAVGAGKAVSARIAANEAIIVERPMYFDYMGTWTGGHTVTAVRSPSTTWYFAEGNTLPGFDQYLCIFNPGNNPAELFLTLHRYDGEDSFNGGIVPPHSRYTYRPRDFYMPRTEISVKLVATQPVIVERAMYFVHNRWTGGSCVMGANALANEFYFAEGSTRAGFTEYLTLQNPSASPIKVDAVYQFGEGQGEPVPRSYEVKAAARATVYVPAEVGPDKDVSVKLTSSSPFLAERPMYFDYTGYGANWTGGHCVIGAPAPASEWFFAEGCTLPGFHEYLCLQNPGDSDATVEITYLTQEAGALPVQTTVVPARSRITSLVNVAAGEGYQLSCRVKVISGPAIVAERPMYFNYNGWDGGHDALGVVP